MLLLIDHLALRARNYDYLIRLFQEWEVGVRVRRDAGPDPPPPRFSPSRVCAPQGGSAKQWGGSGHTPRAPPFLSPLLPVSPADGLCLQPDIEAETGHETFIVISCGSDAILGIWVK